MHVKAVFLLSFLRALIWPVLFMKDKKLGVKLANLEFGRKNR